MQLSIKWDDKTYLYDPNRIDVRTAIVIKGHTGWGLKSWAEALEDVDPLAVQALLWAVKHQNSEPCAIAELNFGVIEFMEAFMAATLSALQIAVAEESKPVDPTMSTSVPKPRASRSGRATAARTPTSAS